MSTLAEHQVPKLESNGDRTPTRSEAERPSLTDSEDEGNQERAHDADSTFSDLADGSWLEADLSLTDCRVILIPVDFSPDSLEAVRQSLVLARSLVSSGPM